LKAPVNTVGGIFIATRASQKNTTLPIDKFFSFLLAGEELKDKERQ
jgi:hypothetical protein